MDVSRLQQSYRKDRGVSHGSRWGVGVLVAAGTLGLSLSWLESRQSDTWVTIEDVPATSSDRNDGASAVGIRTDAEPTVDGGAMIIVPPAPAHFAVDPPALPAEPDVREPFVLPGLEPVSLPRPTVRAKDQPGLRLGSPLTGSEAGELPRRSPLRSAATS